MSDASVTIYVDDKPYKVKAGQNLLHAGLSLGFDIPHFCWHPALNSVGACRQCAVKQFKDANDRKGRLVMACMTPAAEGTRISIDDPDAKKFRAAVIELLMTNHPHDCPICDEGGECHLQDMTVMTGHDYRRFRFLKRTHRNQDLGPLVNHEMNRCIACYRCVRFYRDYAGGRDLDAFGAHHYVYFGRDRDGALESPFSGNLVEVCPTGVFTDKTLKRHFTRKWDLQTAPSICVHCGVGCNTLPGARYGLLRCVRNRYHGEVNGYFLCDRGRYGYEFVNSDRRLREPLWRKDGGEVTRISPARAMERVGDMVRDPERVIGIGSPRASLESNFALRALVGPDRFYLGLAETDVRLLAEALDLLRQGPARTPTLQEVARSDAALVLGEDVVNAAPMLAFSLRQILRQGEIRYAASMGIPFWHDAAVRDMAARHATATREKAPIFIFRPAVSSSLRDIVGRARCASPDDVARLGFAVAHAIAPEAPDATDLTAEDRTLAAFVAGELLRAERPVIVSGPGCGSAGMQAAANVARALCAAGRKAGLCLVMPECNSLGLAMIGGAGGLGAALKAVQAGRAETVIILENDLHRRTDAATVEGLLSARHVIVIDHVAHATASRAELALPAATFAESEGTLVNQEGRAQRFFKVLAPGVAVRESWRWLRDIGAASAREEFSGWRNVDDVLVALASEMPAFSAAPEISPPAGFRVMGQKIPRESHRYSGQTAINARASVHEPQPPEDADSPLAFSMEGYPGQPPAALIARYWAPGWNSPQAVAKFQVEAGGPLRGGDPGRRLIEPLPESGAGYSGAPPPAFVARADEWLLVPMAHVFGSEELSALAPGPAALAPAPHLGLSAEDLRRLQAVEGEELEMVLDGVTHRLPARAAPLANGLAGFPVGLTGVPFVELPAWAVIRKPRKG